MCPSKRADHKRGITLYVDKNTYTRFQKACEFFGVTMSSILTSYMETKASEYEKLICSTARRKTQSDSRTDSQD
jgi:hypothetical protein